LVREIKEETNLDVEKLTIKQLTDFVIPASEDFSKDRHFYFYDCDIENSDFEVYEGDGAEAFTREEIKKRTDLTGSASYVFKNIL
jgi:8-oxo-dGTP pyrophosphatase MutT (NUDIX family)